MNQTKTQVNKGREFYKRSSNSWLTLKNIEIIQPIMNVSCRANY